jgi:hypothetical protein
MNTEISIGDRVKHPTMVEWGIGQVTAVNLPTVTVFFETAKEKKIRTDVIKLERLDRADSDSQILDSKFKAKRSSKRRRFDDPSYFNSGKSASRKKFIESLGGTCANWNWSWSFVNHAEKKIFFGAWQDLCKGNRALVFSESWRTKYGKKRAPWPESYENLRLVAEEEYALYVYTMVADPDSELDYEKGARRIAAILNDLAEAKLQREGDDWYAVFPVNKQP